MKREALLDKVRHDVPTSATLFAVVNSIAKYVDIPKGSKLDLDSRRVFHHLDLRYSGKSADYAVAYLDVVKYLHGPFKCLSCGSRTSRLKRPCTLLKGWTPYCSDSCSKGSERAVSRREATALRKYGVTNVSKSEAVKNRIAESWSKLDRDAITQKILQTTANRYGGGDLDKARADIQTRRAATNIQRYGSVCPLAAPEPRQKCLNTWKENLGVSNPSHSWNVVDKITRSFKRRKQVTIKGREFTLQGDEDKALCWLVSKGVNVKKIECSSNKKLSIPYRCPYKKKNRLYFPDFQFSHRGTPWLMEVKSSYWAGLTHGSFAKSYWLNLRAKLRATVNKGHNLVLFIDGVVWFLPAYSPLPTKAQIRRRLNEHRTKDRSAVESRVESSRR